jgi:hypothetical protein
MKATAPAIHLISFDVPDPADYGGVIDVFHKIRALHDAGVKIILHCFQYGRPESEPLKHLCAEVHYYPRTTGWISQLSAKPYIVQSRRSEALVHRLLQDDHPILCEGLHTTAVLSDPRLRHRKIFVRTANVEHTYYQHLARGERNLLKKCFFWIESCRLNRYEKILHRATGVLAISPPDTQYFAGKYGSDKVTGVYAFHQYDAVISLPGKGEYILYHGKLDVAENFNAVLQMLPLFEQWHGLPLWIAGMNPPPFLVNAIAKVPNARLITNPDPDTMQHLIRDAHAHLLLTAQPTGLKLKLLAALFYGRFVIVNPTMVDGTGLESLCSVGKSPEELIQLFSEIAAKEFTADMIDQRNTLLISNFSNDTNARRLAKVIFSFPLINRRDRNFAEMH